jgi:hypothetical protein
LKKTVADAAQYRNRGGALIGDDQVRPTVVVYVSEGQYAGPCSGCNFILLNEKDGLSGKTAWNHECV